MEIKMIYKIIIGVINRQPEELGQKGRVGTDKRGTTRQLRE